MEAHDIYHAPPPDFIQAIKLYLNSLSKIRSLNTLENQKITAAEYIKHLERLIKEDKWSSENLNIRSKEIKLLIKLLKELRERYYELLKFAQDNPLVMLTGMEPSEIDIIKAKQQQYMEEWNHTIEKLEVIIQNIKERRAEILRRIIEMEREKEIQIEICFKAALELYNLPKDPGKSTELNLFKISGIQHYLPSDKTTHIVKFNHTRIIDNYKKKANENPKNINMSRIKEYTEHAIQTEMEQELHKQFEVHSPQLLIDERTHAVNYVINSVEGALAIKKLNNSLIDYTNQLNNRAIIQSSKKISQIDADITMAKDELVIVENELRNSEKQLAAAKAAKGLISIQCVDMLHLKTEVTKIAFTENEKISPKIIQNKNHELNILAEVPLLPDNPKELLGINEISFSSPLKAAENESKFLADVENNSNKDTEKNGQEVDAKAKEIKHEDMPEVKQPASRSVERLQSRTPPEVHTSFFVISTILKGDKKLEMTSTQSEQSIQKTKSVRVKKPLSNITLLDENRLDNKESHKDTPANAKSEVHATSGKSNQDPLESDKKLEINPTQPEQNIQKAKPMRVKKSLTNNILLDEVSQDDKASRQDALTKFSKEMHSKINKPNSDNASTKIAVQGSTQSVPKAQESNESTTEAPSLRQKH